jgi:hypothetical protein
MVGFLPSKKLRPLESFAGGRDICYYFYYLSNWIYIYIMIKVITVKKGKIGLVKSELVLNFNFNFAGHIIDFLFELWSR